jgi:hypothetical protein
MPESDKTVLDMVDVLLESWKVPHEIKLEDGQVKIERIIHDRKAWWQTHHIATSSLGDFAKERENLGNLFRLASYHMTETRAKALVQQGMLLCQTYDYSIDAKSSECIRDQNNTQLTVLSMLAKMKMERTVQVKGEVQKSFMDSLTGRKVDEASR